MKKRINLLTRQKSYLKIEIAFKTIRQLTYIAIVLFGIFLLVFSFFRQTQKQEFEKTLKEKQNLINYFKQNQTYEAELGYFIKKYKQFKNYYEEDQRNSLLPYYELLSETLKTASGAALNTISMDNNLNTQIGVDFASYNNLMKFIEFVQADNFLDKFDVLTLNNFSLASEQDKNISLSLSGKLKKINESEN